MVGFRTPVRVGLLAVPVVAVVALGAAAAVADPPAGPAMDVSSTAAAAGIRAADPGEVEFIELGYFETTTPLDAWSVSVTNCRPAEPVGTVCDFGVEPATGEPQLIGTHIGAATETRDGSIWFNQPCVAGDGSESTGTREESTGTIFSVHGDQLFFSLRTQSCAGNELPAYWTVLGGTGRFQDASGTMSARSDPETGLATSVGTLRVRADLWEGILPSIPVPVIDPGAVGVQEGNEGQVVVEVPVTLSSPASEPVTVDWATSDTGEPGVATADVDYVAASGTVTFAPGETSRSVSITVNGDTEVEPPLLYGEWGLVEFSNPSLNATLDDSSALGATGVFVIIDDD